MKRPVVTKMDKARIIFTKMKRAQRKDVIEAFIAEAGLTPAGASTYFNNLRTEAQKSR